MLKKALKWLGIALGGIAGALIVWLGVSILLLMCMFSAAGDAQDTPRRDGFWQQHISIELHVNVQDAAVLSEHDSHGGFLGDGTAMVSLKLKDGSMPGAMAGNPNWRPLPMPDALAEEIYDERGWFRDGEGNLFVPEVKNGFYFFLDRHDMAADIFDPEGLSDPARYSQNYTAAVYDAEENVLYYLAVDT